MIPSRIGITLARSIIGSDYETDEKCLDVILRTARHHKFSPTGRSATETLRQATLMKWGPTSGEIAAGRFVFVRSRESQGKAAAGAERNNRDKTMQAR